MLFSAGRSRSEAPPRANSGSLQVSGRPKTATRISPCWQLNSSSSSSPKQQQQAAPDIARPYIAFLCRLAASRVGWGRLHVEEQIRARLNEKKRLDPRAAAACNPVAGWLDNPYITHSLTHSHVVAVVSFCRRRPLPTAYVTICFMEINLSAL